MTEAHFDFDTPVERGGSDSAKWQERADILPMGIADMDFRTAPAVITALEARIAHGVFGYPTPDTAYFEAIASWFARRHGVRLPRSGIIPTIGVAPAIQAILAALCAPGDGVIVQPPVYNRFLSAIEHMGCRRIENPLALRQGRYDMDFADLERKAASPEARVLLLCNPHNPGGRVWTRAELEQLARICARHGVRVVSDEIHGDLAFSEHPFTPFAALAQDAAAGCITCTGAGKAFTISGLQNAFVVVSDPKLRAPVEAAMTAHQIRDLNPIGLAATTAAYTGGEAWLNALIAYLEGNWRLLRQAFARHLEHIDVIHQEGTYLAWIDSRKLGMSSEALADRLVREAGVRVIPGSIFGAQGDGFVRVNFACPRARLKDGLDRLICGLSR
ncbi:pyridoxal phosphate-dependent aminotransferase [Novosphingobium sp. 1949]|uniref:cysteine-S-conjugate beta-lyase n=1 Tax=Novosphingobium organovorum TaxID=2930092 RepID=A0ABT0BBH9_9SPHN|nr:MalY/PatB family protein [Novosphingobium organovorum]MCJ2182144.1 pyridoxal phosphate-dependent aminotransferase [Novosphingobium organovorum]